ncbi:hypothetical protein [Mycobacteroides abscessus]|nr:hypothetical protein [Mycobacteroides abscessus]SKH86739.1 Uncharacterised protein [Mycobacteroides abscessus subsp. massiliense]SKH91104.1 Uncharacterised protein [Mycobacteroides abscessus subsp. massiliense]SKI12238.1 Uncharacterised protein [Mycobacteroides abscessus subsp. massiliense]SKK23560.1 Uncharacterised protein [Mycobacteroides abscessus subsp. massiliense]SKK29510.1 Uncharacterised protein [Mycobacteroides abscessus subsp. massiliense]
MNTTYHLVATIAVMLPVAVAAVHELTHTLQHAAHNPRVHAFLIAKDNDR